MGNCVRNGLMNDGITNCIPTITDNSTLVSLIDGLISYELYTDSDGFADWEAWMDDDSNNPTDLEISNQSDYSDYVLKYSCDFTNVTDLQYSACCIEKEGEGGDCVVIYNDSLT